MKKKLKNKDLDGIYKFYNGNDISYEKKRELMGLYVHLGEIFTHKEIKLVPTGNVRFQFSIYLNTSDVLRTTLILSDQNLNTYNLSKIALDRLKETNFDLNENYSIKLDLLETEFDAYGYMGDFNKKFPYKEYKTILRDSGLYNQEKFNNITLKIKDFKKFRNEFFKNQSD